MNTAATILLLDDEPAVLHFFERVLVQDGYRVITATSGEAALRASAAQEFDLALLDLRLQDMSGLDVLKHLRQRWPATPVIIITAHGSLETSIQALRQGAYDYLLKPCSIADLRESVRKGLLRRQQESGRQLTPVPTTAGSDVNHGTESEHSLARILRPHGLLIDSIRHTATLDDALLDLSPVEFNVLAYLVGEAPRVVAAEEIARKVQGYRDVPAEACDTIRSHIYHIRAKMKAAANRDTIRTVRGIGYAITE
ncbi:MAG TPA: response regulator transcription factor [Anaerolineae bacterium]|nr:response regulator transcription factor [Anaerolineae bacterium]